MTDNRQEGARAGKTDPQLNGRRPGEETVGWDRPRHDGVVGGEDTDPDRRDLRAEIGKYVSLATFPASVRELAEVAEANRAPEPVISALDSLAPDMTLDTTRDLWLALGLEAPQRF